MFKKLFLVTLLVLAVGIVGVSAAGTQTLIVAQGADPVTLDPHGKTTSPLPGCVCRFLKHWSIMATTWKSFPDWPRAGNRSMK